MSAIKDYSEIENSVGFQKELKDIEMEELERDFTKSQSNKCIEILSKS
jgi:hypothetical protein